MKPTATKYQKIDENFETNNAGSNVINGIKTPHKVIQLILYISAFLYILLSFIQSIIFYASNKNTIINGQSVVFFWVSQSIILILSIIGIPVHIFLINFRKKPKNKPKYDDYQMYIKICNIVFTCYHWLTSLGYILMINNDIINSKSIMILQIINTLIWIYVVLFYRFKYSFDGIYNYHFGTFKPT